MGVPIWLAVEGAERQGLEVETARALSYARDIIQRNDGTVDQVDKGISHLQQHPMANTVPMQTWLGKPDFITPIGVPVYKNVRLPFAR